MRLFIKPIVIQVLLLWRRALSDRLDRVFCLVRADLLDYDVSVKAEQQLHNLMQGKAGMCHDRLKPKT